MPGNDHAAFNQPVFGFVAPPFGPSSLAAHAGPDGVRDPLSGGLGRGAEKVTR